MYLNLGCQKQDFVSLVQLLCVATPTMHRATYYSLIIVMHLYENEKEYTNIDK